MVPKTDAALAVYSTNFNARCSAQPELFHLAPEQVAQYTLLHDAFIASFNAVRAEGARCKALVIEKDSHKADLLRYARELYHYIASRSDVSSENKTLIGIKIPAAAASFIPPPAQGPLVSVISVVGRQVRCKLSDASAPFVRRRPINATGAMILTYVGATAPPQSSPLWRVAMQTGKPLFTVEFPTSVGPGVPCWVMARWYNRRGQYSPSSAPVQTYLPVAPLSAAA
jgi:hypothetical protein